MSSAKQLDAPKHSKTANSPPSTPVTVPTGTTSRFGGGSIGSRVKRNHKRTAYLLLGAVAMLVTLIFIGQVMTSMMADGADADVSDAVMSGGGEGGVRAVNLNAKRVRRREATSGSDRTSPPTPPQEAVVSSSSARARPPAILAGGNADDGDSSNAAAEAAPEEARRGRSSINSAALAAGANANANGVAVVGGGAVGGGVGGGDNGMDHHADANAITSAVVAVGGDGGAVVLEVPYAQHGPLMAAKACDGPTSLHLTTPFAHTINPYTDPVNAAGYWPMEAVMRGVYRFPRREGGGEDSDDANDADPLVYRWELPSIATAPTSVTAAAAAAGAGGAPPPQSSSSPSSSDQERVAVHPKLVHFNAVVADKHNTAAGKATGNNEMMASSSSINTPTTAASLPLDDHTFLPQPVYAKALGGISEHLIKALAGAFRRYRNLSPAEVEAGMLRGRGGGGGGGDSKEAEGNSTARFFAASSSTTSSSSPDSPPSPPLPPIIIPAYGTACVGEADCDEVPKHFGAFDHSRVALGYFVLVVNSNEDRHVQMARALHQRFPMQFLYVTRRWYQKGHTSSHSSPIRDDNATAMGAASADSGDSSSSSSPTTFVLTLPNGRTIDIPVALGLHSHPITRESSAHNSAHAGRKGLLARLAEREAAHSSSNNRSNAGAPPPPATALNYRSIVDGSMGDSRTRRRARVGGRSSADLAAHAMEILRGDTIISPPPSPHGGLHHSSRHADDEEELGLALAASAFDPQAHAFPAMGFSQAFNLIINLFYDHHVHHSPRPSPSSTDAKAGSEEGVPMLPPPFVILANADYVLSPTGLEAFTDCIYGRLTEAALLEREDEGPMTAFWEEERSRGLGLSVTNQPEQPAKILSSFDDNFLGDPNAYAVDSSSSSSSSYKGPVIDPPMHRFTNGDDGAMRQYRLDRYNRGHASQGIGARRGNNPARRGWGLMRVNTTTAGGDAAETMSATTTTTTHLRSVAKPTTNPPLIIRWESFSMIAYTYYAWKTIGLFHEPTFPAFGDDVDLTYTARSQGFKLPTCLGGGHDDVESALLLRKYFGGGGASGRMVAAGTAQVPRRRFEELTAGVPKMMVQRTAAVPRIDSIPNKSTTPSMMFGASDGTGSHHFGDGIEADVDYVRLMGTNRNSNNDDTNNNNGGGAAAAVQLYTEAEQRHLKAKLFSHYSSKSLRKSEVGEMLSRFRRNGHTIERWHIFRKHGDRGWEGVDYRTMYTNPWGLQQMTPAEIYRGFFTSAFDFVSPLSELFPLFQQYYRQHTAAQLAVIGGSSGDDSNGSASSSSSSPPSAASSSEMLVCVMAAEVRQKAGYPRGPMWFGGGSAPAAAGGSSSSSSLSSSSSSSSSPLLLLASLARQHCSAAESQAAARDVLLRLARALSSVPLGRSAHYVDLTERRCLVRGGGPWDEGSSMLQGGRDRKCALDKPLAFRHLREMA